jgi:CRP/FNR family transcriptional regulator, anaerobic regulatory protein
MVGHRVSALVSRQAMQAPAAATVISIHELKVHCASCSMRELCLPVGLEPDAMRQLDKIISTRTRVKKRESLYRPGDLFTALYAIRLGTFKTLLLAEDGREQITGYHMAGEIVGLDGISDSRYACQAVALEDSEVCVLPFNQLDELAHDVPLLRRNLYRFISKDICRDQDMMLLLGSRCAEERLALFLLNLAGRYQVRGYSSSEFVLRMTREEIASYLGLKLETVSRLFSHLQEEGLIQVQGRAIKLLDLAALKQLVGQGH